MGEPVQTVNYCKRIGAVALPNMELEAVDSFKYLGSTVTTENIIEEEVKLRIASAARGSWSVSKVLNSNILSRRTRLKSYKTIIRPILTYGCGTLRLTKGLEWKLEVFENGILRRICRPVWDAELGQWRRRHNRELREMTYMPLITSSIMAQRLRWAGHVARAEEDRLISLVTTRQPEGRCQPGRPHMRWSDNVKRNLGKLQLDDPGGWWDVAQDSDKWRLLIVVAKSHVGPQPLE